MKETAAAAVADPEASGVVVKEEPLDDEASGSKRPRSPAPAVRVVRPRLAVTKEEAPAVQDVAGSSAVADAAGPSGSMPAVDEDAESGSSGMEEEEDDEATLDQVGGYACC